MADKKYHPIEQEKLFDHDYDGIQELDNNLPPWWVKLFYITIIWGVLYLIYYHVLGIGYLSGEEYQKAMNPSWHRGTDPSNSITAMLSGFTSPYLTSQPDITPRMLAESSGARPVVAAPPEEVEEEIDYTALTDTRSLATGQEIYVKNCVACHMAQGQGGIGPNLTDDYWIHGDGGINAIMKTVRDGVPVKGMIAWKNYLRPEQLLEVSSYVLSLRGSNPPNPKAPQGQKVTAE